MKKLGWLLLLLPGLLISSACSPETQGAEELEQTETVIIIEKEIPVEIIVEKEVIIEIPVEVIKEVARACPHPSDYADFGFGLDEANDLYWRLVELRDYYGGVDNPAFYDPVAADFYFGAADTVLEMILIIKIVCGDFYR